MSDMCSLSRLSILLSCSKRLAHANLPSMSCRPACSYAVVTKERLHGCSLLVCHGGHNSYLALLEGRGECIVPSVFLLNPAYFACAVIHMLLLMHSTCFMPEFKTVSGGSEQKLSHPM